MKYTCIIGTYNPNIDWLNRALDSAIGLFDEIIVVDDGSGNSSKISQLIPDGVIYTRHESNKGFCEAKNTAIRASTGDIIATLDDDDYFDREGVIKLKNVIEKSDSDIFHFKLQEFGNSNGIYGSNANPDMLSEHNSIPGISWYRKKVCEEVGGFRKVRAEDWNLWYRLYKSGKKFQYVDEVVYNFNVRNGSVSRSWNVPFEEIRIEALETI